MLIKLSSLENGFIFLHFTEGIILDFDAENPKFPSEKRIHYKKKVFHYILQAESTRIDYNGYIK